MFNLFKQKAKKLAKNPYTTVLFNYEIVFKEGAIDHIIQAKGWKNYAQMARELGFTRAYISSLRKRKVACTQNVITRVAAALNNTQGAWWAYFEIVPTGIASPDQPIWNQEKYKGIQPYQKYSSSGQLRSKDYDVEYRVDEAVDVPKNNA